MLLESMKFTDFKEKLRQTEYKEIIFLVLPSLCQAGEFLASLKKDKDKTLFLNLILEQLESESEERIETGINCIRILNSKQKELLHHKSKEVFKQLCDCIKHDNDKIKKQALDLLVSILSSWQGKEREILGK